MHCRNMHVSVTLAKYRRVIGVVATAAVATDVATIATATAIALSLKKKKHLFCFFFYVSLICGEFSALIYIS